MLVPDALTPTGERLKLLDFGIARLDAEQEGTESRTLGSSIVGRIMGTPAYMSPEQCSGDSVVGCQSDVYSLGVVLYQLLGGRPPFIAKGAAALIRLHLGAEPPPLHERAPHAPAELVGLVHALLRKDPDERPSMRQVLSALEKLQATESRPPPPTAGATKNGVPGPTATILSVHHEAPTHRSICRLRN